MSERERGRGRERRLSRTEVEGRVGSARRTERPVLMRETPGRRREEEREGRDSRESREGREVWRGRTRSSRPPRPRSSRPAPRTLVDEKPLETNGSTRPRRGSS